MKFRWLPTESAPDGYPMRIVGGDLFFADGSSVYIPDQRPVNTGWGETGSAHVVGDAMKPVPIRLELVWLSHTEDKFYGGSFELPVERMTALFETGFVNPLTGDKGTYDRIVVGMAPGGDVSVWLAGDRFIVEVAAFRAREVEDVPWDAVSQSDTVTRPEFNQRAIRQARETGNSGLWNEKPAPLGLWADFRRQYIWAPTVSTSGAPTAIWLKALNGEREYLGVGAATPDRAKHAVPRRIDLDWTSALRSDLTAAISFDHEEAIAAYEKLASDDPGSNLLLLLDINEANTAISVRLCGGDFVYVFERVDVEVYRKH